MDNKMNAIQNHLATLERIVALRHLSENKGSDMEDALRQLTSEEILRYAAEKKRHAASEELTELCRAQAARMEKLCAGTISEPRVRTIWPDSASNDFNTHSGNVPVVVAEFGTEVMGGETLHPKIVDAIERIHLIRRVPENQIDTPVLKDSSAQVVMDKSHPYWSAPDPADDFTTKLFREAAIALGNKPAAVWRNVYKQYYSEARKASAYVRTRTHKLGMFGGLDLKVSPRLLYAGFGVFEMHMIKWLSDLAQVSFEKAVCDFHNSDPEKWEEAIRTIYHVALSE